MSSFLSPNQQHQSTEGTTNIQVNSWELWWQNFHTSPKWPNQRHQSTVRWQCSWLGFMLPPCCQDRSGTMWWLHGLPWTAISKKHPSSDNNSIPDPETARCHGEPGTLLWEDFLQAGCPSCRSTNSIKALKAPLKSIRTYYCYTICGLFWSPSYFYLFVGNYYFY